MQHNSCIDVRVIVRFKSQSNQLITKRLQYLVCYILLAFRRRHRCQHRVRGYIEHICLVPRLGPSSTVATSLLYQLVGPRILQILSVHGRTRRLKKKSHIRPPRQHFLVDSLDDTEALVIRPALDPDAVWQLTVEVVYWMVEDWDLRNRYRTSRGNREDEVCLLLSPGLDLQVATIFPGLGAHRLAHRARNIGYTWMQEKRMYVEYIRMSLL